MDTLKFTITNNVWLNNGLARLTYEMSNLFHNEVSINRNGNSVEFASNTEKEIYFYLNGVIKYLSRGTYNYSQLVKLVNKELNYSYSPPHEYPQNKKDAGKKTTIPNELIRQIKKLGYKKDSDTKNQDWKMRMSYLGKEVNYLKYGLNFSGINIDPPFKLKNEENIYKKLQTNENVKNLCPCCGRLSKNMLDNKQFFNPILNEHNNNEIDGCSSDSKRRLKLCPNCATLGIISLFDKFIPFYYSNKNTVLALPNVYDLNILEKIVNNLSLSSQFIDFSDPQITNYNTNILNLNNVESNSLALLNLLNNILNNFSQNPTENLFNIFFEKELIELVDWIFFTKESFMFERIKAHSNIFNILKKQKNPKTNEEIYLVNDFFNRISFRGCSPYQIDNFFKSFLDLDYNSISIGLFDMVKSDVYFYNNSLFLFKEIFLEQIMGEILMLDKNFKKACKSIAETIGRAFYKDIGLMSKFAYATDINVFKDCIEESFFLMAKKVALDSDKIYYSNKDELMIFFEGLSEENFNETKSYFVSFMSSYALYQKFLEKEKSKGGE